MGVWAHMCLCTSVCMGQENNWGKSVKLRRKRSRKKWELCPPMDSNLEPHACEATVLSPALLSLLALTSSPYCVEKLSRNYAQNKFARWGDRWWINLRDCFGSNHAGWIMQGTVGESSRKIIKMWGCVLISLVVTELWHLGRNFRKCHDLPLRNVYNKLDVTARCTQMLSWWGRSHPGSLQWLK